MRIYFTTFFPARFFPVFVVFLLVIGATSSISKYSRAEDNIGTSPTPITLRTPRIEGALLTELQSDHVISSDLKANEFGDTYTTIELGAGFHLNQFVSLQGYFTFEPIKNPAGDRTFEDHGLYAEELYLQIRPVEALRIFAGKFNPAFGIAWDLAPGVYGVDFAEDYEITERLGGGVELFLGATPLGAIALSSSVYTVDTTELSNSLFTERGRTDVDAGGAGNSEKLDSFNVVLDVTNFLGLDNVSLHTMYRHHARGKTIDDIGDEKGYAVGLDGGLDLDHEVKLNWITEYVYIDDVGGQTRDSLTYLTAGAGLVFGRYNVAASYTARLRDVSGDSDMDDAQYSISAGLGIYDGWTLDAGYKYHVEEDLNNHTVGILLAQGFGFTRD